MYPLKRYTQRMALISLLGFFFALVPTTHAQFSPNSIPATLSTSPQYPKPEQVVVVSLNAYALDTAGADITWYVDGEVQSDAQNERSVEFTAGTLGSKVVVRADISRQGNPVLSLTKTVSPSRVDLITEASTYVPAFYSGRALPVEDLPVRFIAIPYTGDGKAIDSYTYTWELDNAVLFGGPVKGKYMIDMNMPRYANHRLTVAITNASGEPVGAASKTLIAATPELYFYESTPLRGLGGRALQDDHALIGDEMTVYGEPYYTSLEASPTFAWKIDGVATQAVGDPNSLTLRKTGGSGSAEIGLVVTYGNLVRGFIQKTFTVFF